MNRLGRWTLDRVGFRGFLDYYEREFGKGMADFLAFMVGLAAIAVCVHVVFWALTGVW